VTEVRWGADGLVPAIVQDATDGRVLMLAWMDAEALEATRSTGLVHFHSRSRGRLWQKGETSGNVLRIRDIALDCDADAILVRADPTGPTCHTGARSCFDAAAGTPDLQGFAWLETLWSTIQQRATDRPAGSYTVHLLEGGVDAVARKVAEEAVEVVMAAKDDSADGSATTRSALAGELGDLLYHTLVLAAERGVMPADVLGVLRARHGSPPPAR
jgi:phosphoribosyl-ATP pyrophosphohydrolase/phosphoribosyl-AMP cyclohydrolase